MKLKGFWKLVATGNLAYIVGAIADTFPANKYIVMASVILQAIMPRIIPDKLSNIMDGNGKSKS